MKRLILLVLTSAATLIAYSQKSDSIIIRKLYDEALSTKYAYNNLDYLCNKIDPRLCGSSGAAAAVEWSKQQMQLINPDTVYLQKMTVPNWKNEGETKAQLTSSVCGNHDLTVCVLGGSVGTPRQGISSKVIEVESFEELESLGEKAIKGNSVFINCKMDPKYINPFMAYVQVAKFRVHGAKEAVKYGAVGVIVRSLAFTIDGYPHTGIMRYEEKGKKIPALSICTKHADLLSDYLKKDKQLLINYKAICKTYEDAISYNVIGEIKGSEFPEKIICVGGHLDSWDNSDGAHDDGVGCVQSMEVLRLF